MLSSTRSPFRVVCLSLLLIPLLGGAHEVQAQTALLRGFVTDAANGQALGLAHVVLSTPDGEVVEGVATNHDGAYVFPRIEPGRYVLRASSIGYEAYRDTLTLAAGAVRSLNVGLTPDTAALDEVVVRGEGEGGAARVIAGQQTIRPAEIELLPSPDLSADLVGYLSTLPAVVTMGDRGGQLFIRGGEPSQNLVLLDGMPIYQPFHVLGFYSAFPADVLQKADVYAGGFGARYGRRLSSVLDIATRNGSDRSFGGAVSVSPFVSALRLEGPLLPRRASLLVSARQSFLEEGAEQLTGAAMPFRFGDALAKLHLQPSPTLRLSVTALNTYDRGVLVPEAAASVREELRWQNQAVGGRLVSLPQFAPFLGEVQLSYSRLHSEQGPPGTPLRSSIVGELRASAAGTFYAGRLVDAEVGFEFVAASMQNELGGQYQDVHFDDDGFLIVAAYLEPEFTPVPGFRIRPGVRFQLYRLDEYPHPEPRLRIVLERGIQQLSAAAGLYHQEIVGISDRRDAASIFTAWTVIRGFGARAADIEAGQLARAVHGLLGYQVSPFSGLDLSVEGFYKEIDDIFVAEWTAYPRLTSRLQPASGRTFGFDARVSLRAGSVQGHVSYGYSNTWYEAERERYRLWYGTETLGFRPPHDRRHQMSALLSASVAGFDLSASWGFGSGLPFSRALGFGGFLLMTDPLVDVTEQGTRRVIYERPYNAVLPTFHRLDVSVERTFPLGAAALTLQASAINAYDRRNLFYLDVFTLRRADQLPFVPSFGIKVAFE